jgi:hypothetical protein
VLPSITCSASFDCGWADAVKYPSAPQSRQELQPLLWLRCRISINVRLMRTDAYKQLELTAQEAQDLALVYKAALEAKHGKVFASPVIERIYNAFGGQLHGKDKQGNPVVTFGRGGG